MSASKKVHVNHTSYLFPKPTRRLWISNESREPKEGEGLQERVRGNTNTDSKIKTEGEKDRGKGRERGERGGRGEREESSGRAEGGQGQVGGETVWREIVLSFLFLSSLVLSCDYLVFCFNLLVLRLSCLGLRWGGVFFLVLSCLFLILFCLVSLVLYCLSLGREEDRAGGP